MTLRNKHNALNNLKTLGFEPQLIVDIGAAAGTEGLYETWPNAHYVLVDILKKYSNSMSLLCEKLKSAEFRVNSVGNINRMVKYSYDPNHIHCVSFSENVPTGWIEQEVKQVTLDEVCYTSLLRNSFDSIVIKIDVDGPELNVLESGLDVLKSKNCVVIVETPILDSRYSRFTTILEYMRNIGYELLELVEPVFRPCDNNLWQVDSIFVNIDSPIRNNYIYG